MAGFNDFDIEIENSNQTDPEQFNGVITTAGTPVTITPSSGELIRLAFINVNSVRDPSSPNSIDSAIKFSINGGISYITLMSGEAQHIPGIFTNLMLDSNNNGTSYQVIVWS